LHPNELKELSTKAKSDIINAGHRYLFADEQFLQFWEAFWRTFDGSRYQAFVTRHDRVKDSHVKQLGGIIMGLFLAQHEGELPRERLYLDEAPE
jgi:hypothetical protein